MEPFEIVMTIINTLAVVAIPIVSVVVAHHLQNRAEKRKEPRVKSTQTQTACVCIS